MQPSSESTPLRPKRRWLQFNLRTLLVLTLVVGCGLGWVASERRKNARIQADLDALQSLGCHFGFDDDEHGRSKWVDWILGRTIAYRVCAIYEFGPNAFTDAGLNRIKGLSTLRILSLDSRPITNTGLQRLKGLTNLEGLYLNSTGITNAGLENLKDLSRLKVLQLRDTAITDEGLENLKGLTNLEFLFLDGTAVTTAGIRNLKISLPKCLVSHDE